MTSRKEWPILSFEGISFNFPRSFWKQSIIEKRHQNYLCCGTIDIVNYLLTAPLQFNLNLETRTNIFLQKFLKNNKFRNQEVKIEFFNQSVETAYNFVTLPPIAVTPGSITHMNQPMDVFDFMIVHEGILGPSSSAITPLGPES